VGITDGTERFQYRHFITSFTNSIAQRVRINI
jgi:hypothetical protein